MTLLAPPELLPSGVRAWHVLDHNPDDSYSRYYSRSYPDYERANVLIEFEPRIRALILGGRNYGVASASDVRHQVAMPWQYLVLQLTSTGNMISYTYANIFWRRNKLGSLDDKVISAKLPDTEPNGAHCQGNMQTRGTPSHVVEETQRIFFGWGRHTNIHTGGYNFPNGYANIGEWEKASEEDPFVYLGWRNWEHDTQLTLRQYFPLPKKKEVPQPEVSKS